MGKVRTVLVKRLSRELVERYPDSFSTEFDQNKEVLDELLTNTTKRLRNRIAGYITRLMIIRKDEDVIIA
ncbi:MAG: 30S ribosomal protein S17e [Promethearchaeota archaeon]